MSADRIFTITFFVERETAKAFKVLHPDLEDGEGWIPKSVIIEPAESEGILVGEDNAITLPRWICREKGLCK